MQCKELNASITHIKAVNKFEYTGKDGSVKWPYIAVCRKAVINENSSHAVNHRLIHNMDKTICVQVKNLHNITVPLTVQHSLVLVVIL